MPAKLDASDLHCSLDVASFRCVSQSLVVSTLSLSSQLVCSDSQTAAGSQRRDTPAEDLMYCTSDSVKLRHVEVPGSHAGKRWAQHQTGAGHNFGDESLTVQNCVSPECLEVHWMLSEML